MQGRFKRDGSAAGDPELRGATDRGSSPQRTQDSGSTAPVHDADGTAAPSVQPDAGTQAAGPREPSGPGTRLSLRNWRISTRLVSLIALPVAAATVLGGFRIVDATSEVEQLENMRLLTEMTEQATRLAAALQEERDRSAGPLTAHGNAKDDTVVGPRERTDQAKQAFNEATEELTADGDHHLTGVQATIIDIGRQLNTIKNIRERAYDDPKAIADTVSEYNSLIESLLALSQDMAQATSNPDMIQSTRALAAFSTAKEYASIQRAVISAGLAPESGPALSENDRRYGKTANENERAALNRFNVIYGPEEAADLTQPLDGGIVNITSADEYASRVFKSPEGIKAEDRSYMDWYDQDRTKIDAMARIEKTLLDQMEQQARELRSEAQNAAIINGAIVLLVLGISLAGAFVVARSMVRSLRRLQDTAQEVASRRLPELVKQLSESDPQDVDTTVESVGVHSRDEIGQVAAAFDDVHREAVRLAGDQAMLRGNVNAMFTNLSRRSQGLIQRQLSLISELESREADPDQLSSLFKLDHLATRMRRNGENLLVLAGEEPGRRWTRPVPLVDVLRAAASEVEQYERIELSAVPATQVAGRVVNDLVHLLAELLENATSFSSPQTKVRVTGHALPDGRVLVEIHDTGIGLSPEDLAAINDRLANPPTVDVSVSRRMGLFVVGRLSLRHGIRIQLRPSDSGGTTALVMLPVEVSQGAKASRPGPGGPGGAPSTTVGREPQSGGPAPGGSRLGAMHTRNQVPGSQRPALPAHGGGAPAPSGGFAPRPPQGGPVHGGTPAHGTPANAPLPGRGADRGGRGAGAPAPLPPAPSSAPPPSVPGPERSPQLPARQSEPVAEVPARGPGSGQPRTEPAGPEGQRPSWARGQEEGFPRQGGPDRDFPGQGGPQEGFPGQRQDTGFPGQRQDGGFPGQRQDTGFPGQRGHEPEVPRGHDDPESTGSYPVPGAPGRQDDTSELDLPVAPAASAGTRTPIFEEMETSWFTSGPRGRTDQPGPTSPGGGPGQGAEARTRTAAPERPAPGRPEARGAGSGAASWQQSPNDERWRRAEQLRAPSAGGITTSGLPRRVPRANLVAGTAEQQEENTRSGPQVSRAPDAVRGRLTNLRRGIQQGREAGGASGSTNRGPGPTYRQER
ncbi:nitrate- and nitrite sensing domain-containing protein [Streptomyces sp. TRM 70351]|uniref:sensor histidine kinase n=1 Tax=Streptomyces sp. TRM 70351 TaxID=3116552 RepID=UPI002E7AF106|nr:nitrate- and nitrite sensing domain-containing protein [Streptomyces sp. TRM 70351]MEE1931556.1 nitrate- and nitrite sensing domain-containing protein [Streptomyces sp. TRM 70351]